MNYDSEMLEKINKEADIVEYVSQTLDLQKKGKDFFASCPKHIDLTPSLSFNPKENAYYCFSCGRGGRMINWLVDFENLSFDEAVNKASKIANVDITKMCQSKTLNFLRKYKAVKYKPKERYQHPILPKDTMCKYKKCKICEWVNEGINQSTMDLFGVRLDEYGNRIVYPVYDIHGNLINVKGRTLYKNYKNMKLAKYMNYFTVGTMDYFQGLNLTLPYIKQANEVIIFESIKSVMKMYGWGYKNCVSAEKHTLTPEQVELLIRLRVNVVFAYDSDVSYRQNEVKENIEKLRKVTNVYIIEDKNRLLGGSEVKNSPVDCGREIWEELYENKRKVV